MYERFAAKARQVRSSRTAGTDRDAEWQRVNSYIADVLKDSHVLYAKLARLQGDFGGTELDNLEKISEYVLEIGGKLSAFSKAFYEGRADISADDQFGEDGAGGEVSRPPVNLGDLGGGEMPTPELDAGVEALGEPGGEPEAPEGGEPEAEAPKAPEGGEPEVEFDYSEDEAPKKPKKKSEED